MSEENETQSGVITEPVDGTTATDEEVTAAVEELVRSVEDAAVEETSVEETAESPSLARTVDTLANSVATLARSLEAAQTLAATALAATVVKPEEPKVGEEAPAEVDDNLIDVKAEALALQVQMMAEGSEFVTGKKLLVGYATTFGTYLGVGLLAVGSMKSKFDVLSLGMIVLGLMSFTASAMFTDRRKGLVPMAIQGAMSVILGAGLGMVIGGIAAFGVEPHRGAVLIPLGIGAFVVGATAKSRFRLEREHLIWFAGAAVWIGLISVIGLGALANSLDPAPKKAETPVVADPATDGAAHADAAATSEHSEEGTHGEDATAGHASESTHAEAATEDPHGEAATEGHETDAHAATAPAMDTHATDEHATDAHAVPEPAPVEESHAAAPVDDHSKNVAEAVANVEAAKAHNAAH